MSHRCSARTTIHLLLPCFGAFLAVVVYAADTGQGQRYWGFLHGIPAGDKIGHIILFGILALLADLAAPRWRWKPWGRSLPVASTIVLAVCVAEEISQWWIPVRSFDLVDLCADLVGIVAGAAVARWWRKRCLAVGGG